MTRDAEADLLIDFEPTVGSEQDDRWRLHRIIGRKHDPAVVDLGGEKGGR